MITWLIRLLVMGALALGGWLVLNRREAIREVKRATNTVDKSLKRVENKAEDVQESKEEIQEAVEDAKERVAEISDRHGAGSVVGRFIRRASPEIFEAVARVEEALMTQPS